MKNIYILLGLILIIQSCCFLPVEKGEADTYRLINNTKYDIEISIFGYYSDTINTLNQKPYHVVFGQKYRVHAKDDTVFYRGGYSSRRYYAIFETDRVYENGHIFIDSLNIVFNNTKKTLLKCNPDENINSLDNTYTWELCTDNYNFLNKNNFEAEKIDKKCKQKIFEYSFTFTEEDYSNAESIDTNTTN